MDTILALQQFASPVLDSLVYWLTNLGSEQAYIVMLVISYLAISPRAGQRLGIALLMSFYLNQVAKAFFDTPRPFVSFPEIVRSEAAEATALGAAFPSGHAQAGTTFWLLAAWYVRRRWFWWLALVLVILLGLSRLYLGVHYPVDIVGGVFLGLVVLLLAIWAFGVADEMASVAPGLLLLVGIGVPLLFHWRYPTADSDLLLGALAAFITAPLLFKHTVPDALWRRIALSLLGVVLAFVALLGSSLLLPEAIKRHPLGGFLRYVFLGYVGTLVVPWLARLTGLSPRTVRLFDDSARG